MALTVFLGGHVHGNEVLRVKIGVTERTQTLVNPSNVILVRTSKSKPDIYEYIWESHHPLRYGSLEQGCA